MCVLRACVVASLSPFTRRRRFIASSARCSLLLGGEQIGLRHAFHKAAGVADHQGIFRQTDMHGATPTVITVGDRVKLALLRLLASL